MDTEPSYGLFEAVGVEMEYAIVDRDDLSVRAIMDKVIEAQTGEITNDVEFPDITWSNELILHMLEVKTTDPTTPLQQLPAAFTSHMQKINRLMEPMNTRLMSTAGHPWMNPLTDRKRWPHDMSEIYNLFDRIFGCKGHGWANIHALHINLPYKTDDEFGRLHAAIRLVLPILPAIAASSPIFDSKPCGMMDGRLDNYQHNCERIPSLTGRLVPEPVFSMQEYDEQIYQRMYRDIAPHDPDEMMREPWINCRGAIARFDRRTIEIRVIDVQECAPADIAIVAATVEIVRHMVHERWCDYASQRRWSTDRLADLLWRAVRDADQTTIDDAEYLKTFGYPGSSATMAQLWRHLIAQCGDAIDFCRPQWDILLNQGPCSRRILRTTGTNPSRQKLFDVYRRICDCLNDGQMLIA